MVQDLSWTDYFLEEGCFLTGHTPEQRKIIEMCHELGISCKTFNAFKQTLVDHNEDYYIKDSAVMDFIGDVVRHGGEFSPHKAELINLRQKVEYIKQICKDKSGEYGDAVIP